MFKNQKGFTLIEMLIVLMIISVLIILIVPNLSDKSKDVYAKGCGALAAVVQTQVESYYLDKGSYPASLEILQSENYINTEQKTCKNGKALGYNPTDGTVTEP
ncbi:competence type IV pilus major pilin ComGC [Virgibacillus necropolis]|uniref:ComG operon protein 3 n=1 Tax=Virgibacillus necropolis TaxID=163877 RepID=A0A221MC43_9BACI|nr:competence type IV pilus major pilin ComGC [Virgibacillus necropolis]ASN05246.1 prepilin-type cleavage/methylation domain-containing protein [Virgibacillus necropolis]